MKKSVKREKKKKIDFLKDFKRINPKPRQVDKEKKKK